MYLGNKYFVMIIEKRLILIKYFSLKCVKNLRKLKIS